MLTGKIREHVRYNVYIYIYISSITYVLRKET